MSGDRYRAGKRLWSPEDDAFLRERYPHDTTPDIAARLRRSTKAVYARAKAFGLHKSEAYLASPAACRLRRGDHVGKATQFKPGQTPVNKGLRRPGWTRGRMAETWFQKGRTNRNEMAVGSTRLVDGYVYRKVSDVRCVAWTVNWRLEHHLVWTRAHGPVPAGHAIVFKNGNQQDTRLENLDCIPRRVLMQRNTVHNLPPTLAQTVQLLGALKRQIRKRSQDANPQPQAVD